MTEGEETRLDREGGALAGGGGEGGEVGGCLNCDLGGFY